MNFRRLLNNLYLFLIFNSEALSEGVTGLIRGTRRVLEYAPRTPKCRHSQQVASDDERHDVSSSQGEHMLSSYRCPNFNSGHMPLFEIVVIAVV